LLEDLHDLAAVAERRGEKLVTIDDVKKRLQRVIEIVKIGHRREVYR